MKGMYVLYLVDLKFKKKNVLYWFILRPKVGPTCHGFSFDPLDQKRISSHYQVRACLDYVPKKQWSNWERFVGPTMNQDQENIKNWAPRLYCNSRISTDDRRRWFDERTFSVHFPDVRNAREIYSSDARRGKGPANLLGFHVWELSVCGDQLWILSIVVLLLLQDLGVKWICMSVVWLCLCCAWWSFCLWEV